jgi:hypothetical protein
MWLSLQEVWQRAGFTALADGLVKGELVHPDLAKDVTNECWISADGDLLVLGASVSQVEKKVGDVSMIICLTDKLISACLFGPNGSEVFLFVWQQQNLVSIFVYPCDDQDLEGVALVHALVSGPLAQSLRDRGLSFDIHVNGSADGRCTSAGLQTQIWPLLGLASKRCTSDIAVGGGKRDALGKLDNVRSIRKSKKVLIRVDSVLL